MQVRQFDRDASLDELLRAAQAPKLAAALSRLLGNDWRVLDPDEAVVLAPAPALPALQPPFASATLVLDIEPLGRLVANGSGSQVEAAAAWLELVLRATLRYRMAAELHVAAVHSDYEALQRKHKALQDSEQRYRELSAQLEQRVEQQVRTIERAQRQLYQSEKMAAVGSLAAGMAHEINNPIGFIRSNLATARTYVQKLGVVLAAFEQGETTAARAAWRDMDIGFVLEDFQTLIEESTHGADRVARIVANLKAYASIDCDTAAPVDLNESVRTVLAVAAEQTPPEIEVKIDLSPLPLLACDQSRINQMLFALLANARQALNGRGCVSVSTRVCGGEVQIAVRDDGCGMTPETQARIFDPFFTTREVGKGMGLGLTVARDIVVAHGGRIDVRSAPRAGSTFTVCLPYAGDSGKVGAA